LPRGGGAGERKGDAHSAVNIPGAGRNGAAETRRGNLVALKGGW